MLLDTERQRQSKAEAYQCGQDCGADTKGDFRHQQLVVGDASGRLPRERRGGKKSMTEPVKEMSLIR